VKNLFTLSLNPAPRDPTYSGPTVLSAPQFAVKGRVHKIARDVLKMMQTVLERGALKSLP